MSNTRAKSASPGTLSEEAISKIIAEAVAPLAKSQEITDLIDRLDKQAARINVLEEENKSKNESIAKLSEEVGTLRADVDSLLQKLDDTEQYTRRQSVRINGLAPPAELDNGRRSKESEADVIQMVEACCKDMGVDVLAGDIDRAHRIGPIVTNDKSKKVSQSIIVKFRSWKARNAFYEARPKFNPDPKGKHRRFAVAPDLTTRRSQLLQRARESIKECPDADFVYVDPNCRLKLRKKNGKVSSFSSDRELNEILNSMQATVPPLSDSMTQ